MISGTLDTLYTYILFVNGLISISLKNLRFRSYHGLYAEEQKAGNEFDVDLTILYQPNSGTITSINDTVDYAKLYDLVKQEMSKPRKLLETLAMELAGILHTEFPQIKKISISITKLQAPMHRYVGKAEVNYEVDY